MLAKDCNYVKSLQSLVEGTLVQVHIEKLSMITNQLPNIDHQVLNEDMAFIFLKGFLLSMNLCGFI
jgi:hypothetical protein